VAFPLVGRAFRAVVLGEMPFDYPRVGAFSSFRVEDLDDLSDRRPQHLGEPMRGEKSPAL
jgi:hypothetical protein